MIFRNVWVFVLIIFQIINKFMKKTLKFSAKDKYLQDGEYEITNYYE